jgi:hypothetical protein
MEHLPHVSKPEKYMELKVKLFMFKYYLLFVKSKLFFISKAQADMLVTRSSQIYYVTQIDGQTVILPFTKRRDFEQYCNDTILEFYKNRFWPHVQAMQKRKK